MSNLLIKDMEIPKQGERKLILIDDNGQVSVWGGHYSFITRSRAREVPEKFYYENGRVYEETNS